MMRQAIAEQAGAERIHGFGTTLLNPSKCFPKTAITMPSDEQFLTVL
jgi:hypothetical protein